MNEKEFNNKFKFSLFQEKTLLYESVFDADQFSPFTRYSIDIRDVFSHAIRSLQKVLSKRTYDTEFFVNAKEGQFIDFYQYHQKMINDYPQRYRGDMRYFPQTTVQQIEEKTIKGVECKIGFYINNKPIVERLFYVDGFNPVSRWSVDLLETVYDIVDTIFNEIKKSDVKNMWDDYDLINELGLSINQIRELSLNKREEFLDRIKD